MTETTGAVSTRWSLGRVLTALAATLLTALSTLLHGAYVEARLVGSEGWTRWVVVDVLLVAAPLVLPAATYAVARRVAHGRQTAIDLSLAVWLVTAFVSCLLAVFWI